MRLGVAAAAGILVAVAVDRAGPAPGQPPAGRPLPARALEVEDRGVTPPRGAPRRRWVDVVDVHAPAPRRILIRAIGVSAAVVPLGRSADGTMQTPRDAASAGWYEPGPEPGERGAAVVVGHVDSRSGPGVFFRLDRLRPGALVTVVRAGGSVVRFRVEGLERWPKAGFPTRRVFGRTRLATLRLVTCSGTFDAATGHYVDNTVVFAVRVPGRPYAGGRRLPG